ncbi:MAG: hypothetical protein AAFN27_00005, partial [Pseudomonadota bacterium]
LPESVPVGNARAFLPCATCRSGAEHLPTIRRPKHYEVVDAMPRHPNGKLRKVEMREHYRQARTPATTP